MSGRDERSAPAFDPWPSTDVHVEWGADGARLAASRGDVVCVVDVLSFSTTLTLAAELDFVSHVWSREEIAEGGGVEEVAAALGARPMSTVRAVAPGEVSLSPATLLGQETGQRVLFTSVNGASVAAAADEAPMVTIGCLRNAAAVAEMLALGREGRRVTVVACGELWGSVLDGERGWRAAVEDLVGAGVIAARLAERGLTLSAEALCAVAAAQQPDLMRGSTSARELYAAGYTSDVDLALQCDVTRAVAERRTVGGRRCFTTVTVP